MSHLKEITTEDLINELATRGTYYDALMQAARIAASKSRDYNVVKKEDVYASERYDAFPDIQPNLHEYFPLGIYSFAQMIRVKSSRILSIVKMIKYRTPTYESLFDSALDLINYCAFLIATQKRDKKSGWKLW